MDQQNREYGDEINLYDIWMTIVKRKRLIIGIFLVSVILTMVISFLMPKIYQGEAVFTILSSEVKAKELIDVIGKIDENKIQMIFPKKYHSITDVKLIILNDSNDKMRGIIEAKNVVDISQAFPDLLNYISNLNFIKMKLQMEQERLTKKNAELSSIIAASSELLYVYKTLLKAGTPIIGFNLIGMNKEIGDLKTDKFNVEQSIQKLKRGAIETAKQLYVNNNPIKPKIIPNVFFAGVASLLLGIFLAFFQNYMETSKKAMASK